MTRLWRIKGGRKAMVPLRIRPNSAAIAAYSLLIIAVVGSAIVPPAPRLVWNVSSSAPVGPYSVGPRDAVALGDMVIARVPGRWRAFAAERHYLPANVPLVKRVAAVPGNRVCANGTTIFVDGRAAARRRATDGAGRALPWWNGCFTVRRGSLFLLMQDPASFDGRYFGMTNAQDLVGKATPL